MVDFEKVIAEPKTVPGSTENCSCSCSPGCALILLLLLAALVFGLVR